jgi:predicted amidophosphoribosyltransferase
MRLDQYTPPSEVISLSADALIQPKDAPAELCDAVPRERPAFCPKCGTPRKQHQLFCRYCYYSFIERV